MITGKSPRTQMEAVFNRERRLSVHGAFTMRRRKRTAGTCYILRMCVSENERLKIKNNPVTVLR